MRHLLLALLALLPTQAFADFDCTVDRQCGGGTCEAFTAGSFAITQSGDTWNVKLGEQSWQAFDAGHIDDTGELVLVMPPQAGMSGMVSIFPDGKFLFTAHAAGPVAISGEGACVASGG
ncbi:MAG: hypothetical protein EON48_07725 [Acetobacteraceae bacterium]|nr:MAG: hypothetical protein EON48_07725 [Acetobacteraceae bacterium]